MELTTPSFGLCQSHLFEPLFSCYLFGFSSNLPFSFDDLSTPSSLSLLLCVVQDENQSFTFPHTYVDVVFISLAYTPRFDSQAFFFLPARGEKETNESLIIRLHHSVLSIGRTYKTNIHTKTQRAAWTNLFFFTNIPKISGILSFHIRRRFPPRSNRFSRPIGFPHSR